MRSTIYLLTLTCALGPHISSAQPNPQYAVKEDAPRTGSNIRRNIAQSTDMAVNRAYRDLSPEDKALLRSSYEQMPETDEPPFPKSGLQAFLKPIAQGQQTLLVRGDLFLVSVVNSNGKVVEVNAYDSPSPEMTRLASMALLLTEFKPGVCAGQPCNMEFPVRLRFGTR